MPVNKKAEFDEKQFESSLNQELTTTKAVILSPGTVTENHLGIDAALVTSNRQFWQLFPPLAAPPPLSLFPFWAGPRGIQLNPAYWLALDQALPHFPRMKFNLFLQYKRPDHIHNKRSSEWATFGRPYFRYDLTPHQQIALERLSSIVGGDALVAYSSPAFSTFTELWHLQSRGKLIANSNFMRAALLRGHKRAAYDGPGAAAKGFSEPENLSGPEFDAELSRLSEHRPATRTNHEFVQRTADYVTAAMEGSGFLRISRLGVSQYATDDLPAITDAFRSIALFCELMDVSWLIGIDDQHPKDP